MPNRKVFFFAVVIIFSCFVFSISSQASPSRNAVTVHFKDDYLVKVLLRLCESAGAGVVLNEEIVAGLSISASIENKPLDEALAIVLAPFDLLAIPHEDSQGKVCYTMKSAIAAEKPSNYESPEFPNELNGSLNIRFENSNLPDALRKILERNAHDYGSRSLSEGIPMSYTWSDKRMKGVKVAILGNGVNLGTIFHALLEVTGIGYEYKNDLISIAPKGYFDPDVRIDLPEIDSPEAVEPIWLLYHDKNLNDILDDMFSQVNLNYVSPSVDTGALKSSVRLEGIPFSTALEAVLFPQRLTYEIAGGTIIIKYPRKW